jgi:DNA-binding MarR family transcriptional regulator
MMAKLKDEVSKRDAFASPMQEAYLNLLRTASQLEGEFGRLFKTHGLSHATYNVLRILRGAISQGDTGGLPCLVIAERLVTQLPDITRLINRLEKADLVARQRDSEDRRVIRIGITRNGLKLLDKLDQPVLDLHAQQLGHLSQAQLSNLNNLLETARHRPAG